MALLGMDGFGSRNRVIRLLLTTCGGSASKPAVFEQARGNQFDRKPRTAAARSVASRYARTGITAVLSVGCALSSVGCEGLLGLDRFRVDDGTSPPGSCGDASTCSEPSRSVVVVPPELACAGAHDCVENAPKGCPYVFGSAQDPRSLRLGALLDLTGPEALTGAWQLRGMQLAIAELNAAGGTRLPGEGERRPLTLIACDSNQGAEQLALALAEQLHVQAILGAAPSDSLALVAKNVTSPHGVLLMHLAAPADVDDRAQDAEPTWSMVPAEMPRVPMLLAHLQGLEAELRARRRREAPKLAVVMRQDIPRTSVRSVESSLSSAANSGDRSVSVLEYADASADLGPVVSTLVEQRPDILVLDGASEVVTRIIAPLERTPSGSDDRDLPYYVLTERAQVPELLQLAAAIPALRSRVSLLSVVATQAADAARAGFEQAYSEHFRGIPRSITGVAASYDAVYAVAYGLACVDPANASAKTLAQGLHVLARGGLTFLTGRYMVDSVLDALSTEQPVTLVGTLGELKWTEQGAPNDRRLGALCIGTRGGELDFVRTGHEYDLATRGFFGAARACAEVIGEAAEMAEGDLGTEVASVDAGVGVNVGDTSTQPEVMVETPADSAQDASVASPAPADAGTDAGASTSPQGATYIGLAVEYAPLDEDPHDGVIYPAFRVINRGSDQAVRLSTLTLRYYFTNENGADCPANCIVEDFYAGLQPAGMAIVAARSYRQTDVGAQSNVNAYLEVTFPASRTALGLGETVEVQQQFHTQSYRALDETNDYSYRPGQMSYADWDRVTLYRGDTLVWGVPPDGDQGPRP